MIPVTLKFKLQKCQISISCYRLIYDRNVLENKVYNTKDDSVNKISEN